MVYVIYQVITLFVSFSQILKCGVCVLSSDDVVSELKSKGTQLSKTVGSFSCTTPGCHVMLALYRTALHVSPLSTMP